MAKSRSCFSAFASSNLPWPPPPSPQSYLSPPSCRIALTGRGGHRKTTVSSIIRCQPVPNQYDPTVELDSLWTTDKSCIVVEYPSEDDFLPPRQCVENDDVVILVSRQSRQALPDQVEWINEFATKCPQKPLIILRTFAQFEAQDLSSKEAVQTAEAAYAKAAKTMQPINHDPYPCLTSERDGNTSKLFLAIADCTRVAGYAKAAEAMQAKADLPAIPPCGNWTSEVWFALKNLWARQEKATESV